jgi:hypothetical protein
MAIEERLSLVSCFCRNRNGTQTVGQITSVVTVHAADQAAAVTVALAVVPTH